jgi:hypothetical protein
MRKKTLEMGLEDSPAISVFLAPFAARVDCVDDSRLADFQVGILVVREAVIFFTAHDVKAGSNSLS